MTQKELTKLKNAILEQGLENSEAVILYGGFPYYRTYYYAKAKAKEIVECDTLSAHYKQYKETDVQAVQSYIWNGKELVPNSLKVYLPNPKNKKDVVVHKGRGYHVFDIHRDEKGCYVWCVPTWWRSIKKELEK